MAVAKQTPVARRPKILVIEDEPSVAAFICTALERHGYDVVPSRSAAEGLELLGKGDFGGIISDFRTPGAIHGADVQDWVRLHRPELAKKMIFVTGDTASRDTVSLLAKTETPFIEKPFRLGELLETVERIIGKP